MKGEYKIFLDDIRTVDMVYDKEAEDDFKVVRTIPEFKELIEKEGVPDFISFDHDLGLDEDGEVCEVYDAVKWMVYEKELDMSEMEFYVHSDNPVGAENIKCLILNWKKELKRRSEQD